MKQINFLPVAVRHRAVKQRTITFMALALLIGLAGVGASWMVLRQEVASVKEQLELQKAAAETEAAQAAKAQQELSVSADLTNRVNQVNTLSQTEVDWSRAFSLVSSNTPKDIYLSSFSYGTVQGVVTLTLIGEAPSNVSFAVFMESLRTSPRLQNVKVTGYTFTPSSGKVNFSLTAQVPPAEIVYPKS